jgi:glutamate synthase domain-containing protein 3
MLIKLEDALKENSYEKYLDYSAYLANAFNYKEELDTKDCASKDYIKSLFRCITPVSAEVRKYLNSALNYDYTVLDKRFIQHNFNNEIYINFLDDSKNISLTDYNFYKEHKIIPNTPFIGLKYYFDIYSFKDLEALILELKEINKDAFIIIKIKDISNIVDYITSGVDEIIVDDINLLEKADKLLKELNLREYVLLSLEYDYLNSYDIINAAIKGSNRFYFKRSILLPLGCMNYNKCYKCPNGIFGNLKYYGNDIYLKRFIDFISYETYVNSSLIGFNKFNDKKKNYLLKQSNISDLIIKNALSGISEISCNANYEDNIGCGLNMVEKNIFIRINGNVGYYFGSYLKNNITLSLDGTSQKYLGKCLDGGNIYVFNNTINNLDDDKNYLVGKNALYKANSGVAYIDGFASSYFAFCNNGATSVVLGMDDYGCSYMTNGVVICLGEVGNNFAYNMTGGIAYIYDEFNSLDSKIDKRFVEVSKLDGYDINYLSNVLEDFSKKTNSKRGKAVSRFIDPDKFIKVIPKNYKVMTNKIKELQKNGLSLNEAIIEVNKLCEK